MTCCTSKITQKSCSRAHKPREFVIAVRRSSALFRARVGTLWARNLSDSKYWEWRSSLLKPFLQEDSRHGSTAHDARRWVATSRTLGHPSARKSHTRYGHLSKRRSPILSPMPKWPSGRTRVSFCSAQRPWREAFVPHQLLLGPVEWLIERVMPAPEPPRTTPHAQRCP